MRRRGVAGERGEPAELDPLEGPVAAVGLVAGDLDVAVLEEVLNGVDAAAGPGLDGDLAASAALLETDGLQDRVDLGVADAHAALGPPLVDRQVLAGQFEAGRGQRRPGSADASWRPGRPARTTRRTRWPAPGSTRRHSRPASTPRAKPANAHPAAATPVTGKTVACRRGVIPPSTSGWLYQLTSAPKRSHDRRHADRAGNDRGDRPTHPAHTLGPGVAEGAGFQLPGQHRRAGERADDPGQEQQDHADQTGLAVAVAEGLPGELAFRGVDRRARR